MPLFRSIYAWNNVSYPPLLDPRSQNPTSRDLEAPTIARIMSRVAHLLMRSRATHNIEQRQESLLPFVKIQSRLVRPRFPKSSEGRILLTRQGGGAWVEKKAGRKLELQKCNPARKVAGKDGYGDDDSDSS